MWLHQVTKSQLHYHMELLIGFKGQSTWEFHKLLSLVVMLTFLRIQNQLILVQLLHYWWSTKYFMAESWNSYFNVSVDYAIWVTKIESIRDGQHNLCDLCLVRASWQIFCCIEFSSLAEFHHNVEISWVIVDLIDLENVRMFKLNEIMNTVSIISHSFMYILRSYRLIFLLR